MPRPIVPVPVVSPKRMVLLLAAAPVAKRRTPALMKVSPASVWTLW